MSMLIDACFKKEWVVTLFVWVGALEGGVGGGCPSGVSTPKSKRVVPKKKKPPERIPKNLLTMPYFISTCPDVSNILMCNELAKDLRLHIFTNPQPYLSPV